MNTAHLHLILNHIPVVGLIFSLALLIFAVIRKSEELRKTAFVFFVAVACFAIPAYLTGEGAEEVVEHLPGVSEHLIEEHEEVADAALIVTIISGGAALAGLFYSAFTPQIALGLIALGIMNAGLLGYTAKLGGEVRHTEIRGDIALANSGAINQPGAFYGDHDHDDD